MDNILNFNNHIDKKQNKQRYLGYEKGKILESKLYSTNEATLIVNNSENQIGCLTLPIREDWIKNGNRIIKQWN